MDGIRNQTNLDTQSRNDQILQTHDTENPAPVSIRETGVVDGGTDSSSSGTFLMTPAGSLDPNELPALIKAKYLETFVTQMLPQYPVLAVTSQIDIESLQNGKSFAFRAIMTTACSISDPKSFRTSAQ